MVCRFGTQAVMGLLSLWKQCSSRTKASPTKQHHFGIALSSVQFSNLVMPSKIYAGQNDNHCARSSIACVTNLHIPYMASECCLWCVSLVHKLLGTV